MAKKNLLVFFVIFLGFISVVDLLNYGMPPTHDGEYHIMRFWQFYKVLSDGIFFPRWAPDFNNGFGIPLFTYVYPLPNYIASFFHFLGFGFIESFKASMILATLVGSVLFYLWAEKYWGKVGGFVSAIFYIFSPYRLLDIYVRGSVGEVWALSIFPGLLWGYFMFISSRRFLYFVISCVFMSLLIYSHNILALMFVVFFAFYSFFILVSVKNRKGILSHTLLIYVVSFGLAAPFWIPAIFETSFVTGLRIFDIASNFTPIYKFFVPTWGFGLSPLDPVNPMSVQIGYANLLAVFLSACMVFYNKEKRSIVLFSLVSFLIVFFLMTPLSLFLWEHIPLMSYFQFPWRLLSLEILISSFLAGYLIFVFKKRKRLLKVLVIILVLGDILLSIKYIKAPFYHQRDDLHYLTRSNFANGTNSPGDAFNTKWLESIPSQNDKKVELIKGSGRVVFVSSKASEVNAYVNLNKDSELQVNIAYFPGFTAKVDGEKTKIVEKNGLINLKVKQKSQHIKVQLESTLIQKISYLYFLVAILLIIYIRNRYGNRT